MAEPSDPNITPQNMAFDPAKVGRFMAGAGHSGWLGMQYHGHCNDWIELALPWREDLVGVPESGLLASGPIITLMDMATSMSVWLRRGTFGHQATIDLRIDYARAARPHRKVIGRGECYRLSRSIAFVRGIAYDDSPDDPIASVAGTFMVMDGA